MFKQIMDLYDNSKYTLDYILTNREIDESRCCNQWYATFKITDGTYEHTVDYTNCEHASNREYYDEKNWFRQRCVIPGDLIITTEKMDRYYLNNYELPKETIIKEIN